MTLVVKVYCPFGNSRPINGVNKGMLTVAETVNIPPGPPALVVLDVPPVTLDIEMFVMFMPIESFCRVSSIETILDRGVPPGLFGSGR